MTNLTDILLPYQLKFFKARQKRKIWISARQVGKSLCSAFISSFKSLARPNGLSLVISTGAKAASEMIRKCVQVAEAVKVASNGKITFEASADCVKFNTGSRIMSLPSGNPAALRGWSAQAVIIDEAAFCMDFEEVMMAIAPTLTRDPTSELIFCTTPAGKNGPFYDLYQKAKLDEDWYVQETTIYDAMADGLKVDIESLKSLCPDEDSFKQEYCCDFLDEYGAMLDVQLLKFEEIKPNPNGQYFLGMDVGFTGDRTVFAILEKINKNEGRIADVIVMRKASYQEQLDTLKQLNEKWKFKGGYVDSVGIGGPIAEFAKKINFKIQGFYWTATNKTPAYEDLRAAVFDGKIAFNKDFRNLIESDFRNVSKIVTSAGQIRYQAGRDENGHSDFVSAAVLAWQAAKKISVLGAPPVVWQRHSAF